MTFCIAARAGFRYERGIELARILGHRLSDRAGDRKPRVGVDVDLADAVADAQLDLLDRHAPGRADLAAVLVDDVDELLRHRRRAVHDEVGRRELLVDLLDHVHREHRAVGLARELVGAVARADGDRERVDAGLLDELDRLVGVGQVDLARADAVLDPAQRPELALDRDADGVRVLHE